MGLTHGTCNAEGSGADPIAPAKKLMKQVGSRKLSCAVRGGHGTQQHAGRPQYYRCPAARERLRLAESLQRAAEDGKPKWL